MKLCNPTLALLGAAAALLSVSSASAQVNYTETFDTDLAGWAVTGGFGGGSGWAGGTFRFPIGGVDGSPVINIYSGAPTGEITSPLIGTATGSLISFSFDTKKNNFAAATGETDLPHGTIEAFYGPTATGPWTSIVAVTDQIETGTAYNVTGTFTASGDVYIQFQCSHAGGDWDGYVDNLSVVETGGNPPATHTNYGTGCYTIETNQAVYQNWPDQATSSAALLGTSFTFTPTANGYTLSNGGGTYVAPSGSATVIALGDDASAPYTPSMPFPHVDGPATDLEVHSNCFVSMGPGNSNSAYGSVPLLLNSTVASFRANFDLNPSIAGSAVSAEEIGNVLHITWEAPRFNFTLAEIERVQMQFDLVSGTVVMIFDTLANAGSTGDTVVGYAPGVSTDPGAIDLAVDLPITTEPDSLINAISLSASPAPVSTSTTGTTVMYQIDDIPDATGTSGVYFGTVIISFTGDITGTDLGFAGMPGCNLHVGALDVLIAYNGASSSQMVPLSIPANVPAGTQLWAQAAALVVPGSLPNGQNTFGAVTSNGVESYISDN